MAEKPKVIIFDLGIAKMIITYKMIVLLMLDKLAASAIVFLFLLWQYIR